MSQLKTIDKQINVEQRVIKQLIEALLFEGIITYRHQHGVFHFTLSGQAYRANGKISGFGRIRLIAESITCLTNNIWSSPLLRSLVNQLPTSSSLQDKLMSELSQTIKLCRWNQLNLNKVISRRELSYTELESAIDEGHPYHPCFKARTGFSISDHQYYGPEASNAFQLHWLAVKKDLMKQNLDLSNSDLFWQKELTERTFKQLKKRLNNSTEQPETYTFLPIHPWQWNNLQTLLLLPLQQKNLLDLGVAGDNYQASISVRTLLNISRPEQANIKLPLNMVNTSSLRTLESHSICVAPVLSQWLDNIISSDQYLQQHISILPEYAGIRLTTQTQETKHKWLHQLDGQIGVIFRQSLLHTHQENNVIPFVALTIFEQDNLPFIDPWIQRHGCEAWLKQLIDTAILPIWHLLVHHGIALEAHAQNLILSHKQGWPTQVILRDFHESLEYVPSFLKDKQLTPNFLALESIYQQALPDQYYWMEDVEALRELLIDTLFIFNLSDLATLFEDHYQFSEAQFWQQVFHSFSAYRHKGYTDPQRIDQVNIHEANIQTESLLKKKLNNGEQIEFHHSVQNPLIKSDHVANKIDQRSMVC